MNRRAGWAVVFFGAVVALIWVVPYAWVRGWWYGAGPGDMAKAVVISTIVLLVPVLPVALLLDDRRGRREHRRAKRGLCVACGYDPGIVGAGCCPECGAALRQKSVPTPDRVGPPRLVPRAVGAIVLGTLIAVGAGEVYRAVEEARFRAEVEKIVPTRLYGRDRWFPHGSVLIHDPGAGVFVIGD